MIRIGLLLIVLQAIPSLAWASGSLRCGSELLDVGDTAIELEAACGAPDHVDRRTIVKQGGGLNVLGATEITRTYEEIETWTYAGEDGRLMQLVEIGRGKVTAIRSIGVRGGRDLGRCERTILAAPTLSGQVEVACGPADDVSRWVEERILRDARGFEVRELVTRERWIYVPGPGRFIRIFDMENGRLVRESTGARVPR